MVMNEYKIQGAAIMFILPIIIILSLVLYVYYKVAILKYKDGLTHAYYNARARVFLGLFVGTFWSNHYLFYQCKISLLIGIFYLLLGLMQLTFGYKQVKFYHKE